MESIPQYRSGQLLGIWENIGKKNLWIWEAYDPPFDKTMLVKCQSIDELAEKMKQGNWCLGQGYYLRNLCFINQIDGGDEWLTIKDDYAFESITFRSFIQRGEFDSLIERLLNASREDCINLKY